jgi:prepilin-type N-terminal cleavage/methylation domain-containing protein
MIQQAFETRRARRRRGFTLLELIAVMGIIVAMSVIVVGGYRGMMSAIAQRAGVDALAKAVTLCRQYATIDGKETYFWITGFDTYVICRKAGKVDNNPERVKSRPLEDYEKAACGYLPAGNYSAYWITDSFADLGSAEDYTQAMDEDAKEAVVEAMEDKTYNGGLVFDFTAGKVARIRYPAWFVAEYGYWIMGLMGPAREDSPPNSFKINSEYGWMVGPEYQLPKGYVFDPSMYKYKSSDGEFQEGERFYFRPDGTPAKPTGGGNVKLVINEIGTNQKPEVVVRQDGTISWDYDDE